MVGRPDEGSQRGAIRSWVAFWARTCLDSSETHSIEQAAYLQRTAPPVPRRKRKLWSAGLKKVSKVRCLGVLGRIEASRCDSSVSEWILS